MEDDPNGHSGSRWLAAIGLGLILLMIASAAVIAPRNSTVGDELADRVSVGVPSVAKAANAHPSITPEIRRERARREVSRHGIPIYRGGGNGKYVAFTFDDGPGPYTGRILGVLDKHGASASFFVTAQMARDFEGPLRAQARHQEVGNHSWSHPYLPGLPPAEAWKQVTSTNQFLKERTGTTPRLFRPPYGAHTSDVRARIKKSGMTMVLWDVDSQDTRSPNPDVMLRRLLDEITPGSIVLFHEHRVETHQVLEPLLVALKRRGYSVVSVGELLELDPPTTTQLRAEAARRADDKVGTRY